MELQLEQQQISCLVPCAQRDAEERVSSDFVVPDSLPDAAALLLTEGNLCLWRLDLSDGCAELEGEITAWICCADEQGEPMSFPVRQPVQLRLRADAIESGQKPFIKCRLKSLDAHLLNSRKVRMTGIIFFSLVTYSASEISVTTGINTGESALFCRKQSMKVPFISSIEEQVFTAEESISLQMGVPFEGRLISCVSAPIAESCECRDQRVTLKGSIRTTLLYVDAMRKELVTEFAETPFACLLDVSGDASKCRFSLHLTREEVRCRNDEPAVDTEFHLVAQVICYGEREIEVLTDAYSNRAALTLSWTEQMFPACKQQSMQTRAAEGEIPCSFFVKTVCAVRAMPRGDGVEVTVLLRDENQSLRAVSGELKLDAASQSVLYLERATVQPGDHHLNIYVPYLTEEDDETYEAVRSVSGAILGEETRPLQSGVTLIRREEGADLWELAKNHASSMEAIQTANPDREPQSNWILIPHVL